jgi:hypothetical protein
MDLTQTKHPDHPNSVDHLEPGYFGWNPKADSNQITEYYENINNNPPFSMEDGEVIIPLEIFKAHFKNLSTEFLSEHS